MKRFVIGVVVLSIVGLLGHGEALAKKGKKKSVPATAVDTFKSLDKDGDGKLSLDEFKAGKTDAQQAEKSFKALDKDNDGALSKEEFGTPATTVKKNKNKTK
jgi:Ca2+-binding EF-hand superfamily protein